jgi:hypothetical protein
MIIQDGGTITMTIGDQTITTNKIIILRKENLINHKTAMIGAPIIKKVKIIIVVMTLGGLINKLQTIIIIIIMIHGEIRITILLIRVIKIMMLGVEELVRIITVVMITMMLGEANQLRIIKVITMMLGEANQLKIIKVIIMMLGEVLTIKMKVKMLGVVEPQIIIIIIIMKLGAQKLRKIPIITIITRLRIGEKELQLGDSPVLIKIQHGEEIVNKLSQPGAIIKKALLGEKIIRIIEEVLITGTIIKKGVLIADKKYLFFKKLIINKNFITF